MAITVNYQPSPLLVGQAAYDIGLGERLQRQQAEALRGQQLDEQARQFDVSHSLDLLRLQQSGQQFDAEQAYRQQALAAQQEQDAFAREAAKHRDYLARYGLMQQAANADANRMAGLAEVDLRGQYGLLGDQLAAQTQLAREQIQQQGQNFREGETIQNRYGLTWQDQAFKQMQADWQNVQKALPKLDPQEREELIGKFQQRWQDANVPLPVEMPEQATPEWMDPQAKLDQARTMYPNAPWQINEKGELQLPRGWNYQMSPEYLERQKELESIKSENKAKAAEEKAVQDAIKNQAKLHIDQQRAYSKSVADYMDTKISLQQKIHEARAKLQAAKLKDAEQRSKAKQSDALGKYVEPPATDWSEQENDIKVMQDALNNLSPPSSPTATEQGVMYSSQPQSAPPSEGPPQWYLDLPSGATYTAPDGTQRVKP